MSLVTISSKWKIGTQSAKYECIYGDSKTKYFKLEMSLQNHDGHLSCYKECRNQESIQADSFLKNFYLINVFY